MTAPGTPVLNGYVVTWDYDAGEWVARDGRIELRGRDQAGLDAARWDLIIGLADKLGAILHAAPAYGLSPPPPRG